MGFINNLNYWKQWSILNKNSLLVMSKRSSLGKWETSLLFLELVALDCQGSLSGYCLSFAEEPRAGVRIDKPISLWPHFAENVLSWVRMGFIKSSSCCLLIYYFILFYLGRSLGCWFQTQPTMTLIFQFFCLPFPSAGIAIVYHHTGLCGPWIKSQASCMLGGL